MPLLHPYTGLDTCVYFAGLKYFNNLSGRMVTAFPEGSDRLWSNYTNDTLRNIIKLLSINNITLSGHVMLYSSLKGFCHIFQPPLPGNVMSLKRHSPERIDPKEWTNC